MPDMAVQSISVSDKPTFESTVSSYMAQGYTIEQRQDNLALLSKRKELNVLVLFVGFILGIIPAIGYLIYYATMESDKFVRLEMAGGPAGESAPSSVSVSPDGRYWWDGGSWLDVATAGLPPGAERSPEGHHYLFAGKWYELPHPAPPQLPPPA